MRTPVVSPQPYKPTLPGGFADKKPGDLSEWGFYRGVMEQYGARGLLEFYLEEHPEQADFFGQIEQQYGAEGATEVLLESLIKEPEAGFGELREEEIEPAPSMRRPREIEQREPKEIGTPFDPMLQQEERQAEERQVEQMLAGSMGVQPQAKVSMRELRELEQEDAAREREEAAREPEVLHGDKAQRAAVKWLREESKKWPEPLRIEEDPQWEAKLRWQLKKKFYPDEVIDRTVESTKMYGILPGITGGEIPEWEADWSVKDVPSGLKVLFRGLLLHLPKEYAASLITGLHAWHGASVVDKGKGRRFIENLQEDRERTYREYLEKYKNKKFLPHIPPFPKITIMDIAELPQNLSFSGVAFTAGAGAGFAAGVPVAALPIPGARAAAVKVGTAVGAGATGVVAYRMASFQFMQEFLEIKDAEVFEKQGRHITLEEENRLKNEFNHLAIKHGLWEAIPEAVGAAAGFSVLMAPLKRVLAEMGIKAALANRMLTKFALIYGEEAFTETVTELGQAGTRKAAGMPGGREVNWLDPGDWLTAYNDIAPATFLLTATSGGAGAGAIAIARKISSFKREVSETHPAYEPLLNKILSGEDKQAVWEQAELTKQLLQSRAMEAPKHIEVAEADGVQRTFLEAEPLPEVEAETPTSPTVRRARLAEGDVVLAPILSGGQERLVKAEIIDASDPSLLRVRTESGAEFRTGRANIKLLDEVTLEEPAVEEPVTPTEPEMPTEAPAELPVEEAVTPTPKEVPVPMTERPVRRLPEGRATRIDVLTRKNDLLAEIDEAIVDAPEEKVQTEPIPPPVLNYRAEEFRAGLEADSALEGGEVQPSEYHSWRSMGQNEYGKILRGEEFGGPTAQRGDYWSWFPAYSSRLEGSRRSPKYLVEVNVKSEDQHLLRKATIADVTGIWRSIGSGWERVTQKEINERAAVREDTVTPKIEFKIDGGTASVFNTKNSLKNFRKRAKAMPLNMFHPERPVKPSTLKPIAPTRQRIDKLVRGMPDGWFTDGSIIVRGNPPARAKYDTDRAELEDSTLVTELLDQPTQPAEQAYYVSISDQDIGVSDVPIANLDPENRATPRVIYKSRGKYFSYDQYRHNVVKKRFPNATYGITPEVTGGEAFEREGMLIAYENGEPVAALMPFNLLDTVAMTDPPGLADALELGAADPAVVVGDVPAPGELNDQPELSEQEFIDQSPPIGMSIRRIIPPFLKGKIERPQKDITGIRGAFLRLGPARTLAMDNPVWNQIIHMARDTLEGLNIQLIRYNERVRKVFKGIKKNEVEAFIDLLEAKGRPENIPPHLVAAYDEMTAIRKEFYNMIRDEMGIDVSQWGMTPEEYWPHIFVGSYEILTPKMGKEGKVTWRHIEGGFARNVEEAVDKAVAYHEENPDADFRIRPRQMKWDYSSVPLTRKGFWRLVGEVEKAAELDKEEVLSMMKGVAKIKPRGKFVGNFIHRDVNLGGYMKEEAAFRIYMGRVLRKKWLDPFNKKASDLAMSLPPGLRKYALEYIDAIVGSWDPYDPEYKMRWAVSKITRAQSALKLGYRPVTAVVNRLQPMQLAFPEIGHYLWKGWHWKHTEAGKQLIEESGIRGDMPYYASGEMGEYVRRIGSWLHPLGLFTKAEMANREDVICGGYLYARKVFDMDRAKAEKHGFDYILAYLDQYEGDKRKAGLEYAKDLNAHVNFIYSNADLPAMFKSKKGRVFLQFKTYPINAVATAGKWVIQDPRNAHYVARLSRLIGGNILLGGVRSAPYIGKKLWHALVFSHIVGALMPVEDRDWRRKVLGGGIFSMLGVDLATRLGPNEFIPTNMRQLVGPMGSDLWTLYDYYQTGDWKAFLRASPLARDIITALSAPDHIVDPNNRMRKVMEITGWQKWLEGTGVPLEKRRVLRDVISGSFIAMSRAYKRNKAVYEDRIYNEWNGIDETLSDEEYNEQMQTIFDRISLEALDEHIYIEPQDVYDEAVLKGNDQITRAYKTMPVDLRPELLRRLDALQRIYGILE